MPVLDATALIATDRHAIDVTVPKATPSASSKIEAAGGSVTLPAAGASSDQ